MRLVRQRFRTGLALAALAAITLLPMDPHADVATLADQQPALVVTSGAGDEGGDWPW